jgi:hypothetical protein
MPIRSIKHQRSGAIAQIVISGRKELPLQVMNDENLSKSLLIHHLGFLQ